MTVLELSLENKRLREALGMAEVALGQAANELSDVHPPAKYLRAHQTSARKTLFLSTPPPALAEAYVRLRESCSHVPLTLRQSADLLEVGDIDNECEGVRVMAQEMSEALAEIERLEKGE